MLEIIGRMSNWHNTPYLVVSAAFSFVLSLLPSSTNVHRHAEIQDTDLCPDNLMEPTETVRT